MPPEHQRRAIKWFLHQRAIAPPEPATFIRPEHHQPPPAPRSHDDEPIDPARYDTGLTPDEDPWTRRGWAGRP